MGQRLNNATNRHLEAIRDGNYEQAINANAGRRDTQHSTPVKDGKESFIEFFAEFVRRNPIRDIQILGCFEDGPHVFLHVRRQAHRTLGPHRRSRRPHSVPSPRTARLSTVN